MTLDLTHDNIKHLIMEVNQDIELNCTQDECPYWNDCQKDCDSKDILELDWDKLFRLLELRGLKPRKSE